MRWSKSPGAFFSLLASCDLYPLFEKRFLLVRSIFAPSLFPKSVWFLAVNKEVELLKRPTPFDPEFWKRLLKSGFGCSFSAFFSSVSFCSSVYFLPSVYFFSSVVGLFLMETSMVLSRVSILTLTNLLYISIYVLSVFCDCGYGSTFSWYSNVF